MVTGLTHPQDTQENTLEETGTSLASENLAGENLAGENLGEMDAQSLWHAIANHKPFAQNPPKCIQQASGCYVTDAKGVEYLDGVSGLWCVSVGYGRQEIDDVAYEQMLNLAS